MNIAILGTGRMGSGLGKRWAAAGHNVFFGTRDPGKSAESIGANAQVGNYADAANFGEVVALTVPFPAAREILNSLSAQSAVDLRGKILIDVTNDWQNGQRANSSRQVESWAGGTLVVKAFCTVFSQILGAPFDPSQPRGDVPFVGDDAQAKATVAGLIRDAGFEPVDGGGLDNGMLLDALVHFIVNVSEVGDRGSVVTYKFLPVTT